MSAGASGGRGEGGGPWPSVRTDGRRTRPQDREHPRRTQGQRATTVAVVMVSSDRRHPHADGSRQRSASVRPGAAGRESVRGGTDRRALRNRSPASTGWPASSRSIPSSTCRSGALDGHELGLPQPPAARRARHGHTVAGERLRHRREPQFDGQPLLRWPRNACGDELFLALHAPHSAPAGRSAVVSPGGRGLAQIEPVVSVKAVGRPAHPRTPRRRRGRRGCPGTRAVEQFSSLRARPVRSSIQQQPEPIETVQVGVRAEQHVVSRLAGQSQLGAIRAASACAGERFGTDGVAVFAGLHLACISSTARTSRSTLRVGGAGLAGKPSRARTSSSCLVRCRKARS
jgi:hypothetical protein